MTAHPHGNFTSSTSAAVGGGGYKRSTNLPTITSPVTRLFACITIWLLKTRNRNVFTNIRFVEDIPSKFKPSASKEKAIQKMVYVVEQLVKALRYKTEGHVFDSLWGHWHFSLT